MTSQDGIACMFEAFNPRLGCDFFVARHKVTSNQETADCHHCNKVAHHGWDVCTIAGHQPQLGNHRNSSNEEATHPKGVKDWPVIEISMKQAGEDQGAQCVGGHWNRIIVSVICLALNNEHVMQEPEHHDQGQCIDDLVQIVSCHVIRQVTLEPCC